MCAGAAGDTDKAVQDYLDGTLEDAGVTCDHHHEEGHSCGDHEEGHSCGGDCQVADAMDVELHRLF